MLSFFVFVIQDKSMDWFLYERDLLHERAKKIGYFNILLFVNKSYNNLQKTPKIKDFKNI